MYPPAIQQYLSSGIDRSRWCSRYKNVYSVVYVCIETEYQERVDRQVDLYCLSLNIKCEKSD